MGEEIQRLIEILSQGDKSQVMGIWEVLIALSLSLVCTLVVARVYRFTHRDTTYQQSFVQTLVLVSLVTTLIMIVIGSNIARAFSLVGALSIIRFRNAVKETRDVGYIFFAMAIAMAAGTRFYSVAVLATTFITCVLLAFHHLEFGAQPDGGERLVRVNLPPGREVEDVLGEALRALFEGWSVVRLESVKGGLEVQATLSVRARSETKDAQVLLKLQEANDGRKVSYQLGQHSDDL